MSFKPLIFLFFVWLVWGGIVAQNVYSQNSKNQQELAEAKLQSQGQVLEWFFQERTLQLKGIHDDEPVVSRYSTEQWKSLDPWKGIIFIKNNDVSLYGAFDKMMPEAHRKQLVERVSKLKPAGRIEGVYWESFQWNGTAFIVAFVSKGFGAQGFIALAEDWGRSLSLISNDSGWYITNLAGRIIFHSDSRYVGEKLPASAQSEMAKNLKTTNLVGRLKMPEQASSSSLVLQLVFITVGLALISGVLLQQYLKKERQTAEEQVLTYQKMATEARNSQTTEVIKPEPVSNDLLFKDLSHRVSSSLGRQLQPSFINILGQAQWLMSVSEGRNQEEKKSIEAIVREARQSKGTLDKLLAVAGENELHKFPMKLETPVLRALKKWEPDFLHEHIELEKEIGETSFFPLNSEALEKALGHMIQNSVESLSRQLEKKIKVEVKDEGDRILLSVEDNGAGIEPHHLTLISDPFFTTKNHQGRLGLGLTEAFGIFKQHHAIVSVTSTIGKGTRIEVRFDKNAAQDLVRAPIASRDQQMPDDFVIIPQSLPKPLEMPPTEEEMKIGFSPAVDDEIEKLLDITDLDFMESADESLIRKQKSEEAEARSPSVDIPENFLDENPLQADTKENNSDDEEDEFKMKGIQRGMNA